MKAIVTGAAGFIGSHLAKKLLKMGWQVTGIDSITDYYSPDLKQKNISELITHNNFHFFESSILGLDWNNLYESHDYVFHLAGQPGVRASWGKTFNEYVKNNISTAQFMLEAAVGHTRLKRFIFASTSSVYGDAESFPTSESAVPKPVSPYGVTKLAAENLCYLYYRNYGIPTVSLRYFTVYGPGQRPDMAFHKIFKAMVKGTTFSVFGDGKQTRDFTYVGDIVEGNVLAASNGLPGKIYNLGGGSRVSLSEVISIAERISGYKLNITYAEAQKGDARDTSADIQLAKKELGYSPSFNLEDGLVKEWEWFQNKVATI